MAQNKKTLSLQPFLVTKFDTRQSNSTSSAVRAIDIKRKLLLHGILLMEIFRQDPLQKKSNLGTDLKMIALETFKTIEWDLCERLGQVVKTCINGELIDHSAQSATPSLLAGSSPSLHYSPKIENNPDEQFGRLFCERIIAPIETDFKIMWQSKDPDQVISTLSLPKIEQKVVDKKPKPSCLKRLSVHALHPTMRSPLISRRGYQPSHSPKSHASIGFFDVLDPPDSIQVKQAARWFEKFEGDDEIKKQLRQRASSTDKRIKIAVLDTGINMKNVWISQKTGRIQCWPPGSDFEGKDGHGTHVAHLILRLAPHVLLRIAKVSNTVSFREAEIKHIADAITHFSTGAGRVDIINIYFGFPTYKEKLQPILAAIRLARSNGVIIFAAAGNEGGNQGVFWPASLHDSGDVIRINSSDGQGVPSGFNPDPEVGRGICTLGEGVPSCRLDQGNQTINRSGTSFATPVAATIAAIVLGFMDNMDLSEFEDSGHLLRRLRTAVGMEKVLCETCVRQTGQKRSGYFYITPWYFLGIPATLRVNLIIEILKRVPESSTPYTRP